MAEDFNIRLSVDTSEGRTELLKFQKAAMDAVKFTKRAMAQIVDISDSISTTNSVGEIRKLTNEIAKLKKAAGDKGPLSVDSVTSMAKVVENALKPSKAKGVNAAEIKRLQKQLSQIVSTPSENITQVTSLLESMRGVVASLSRPNKQAAKDAMQLRRELDNLRKEFTVLSHSVNAGTATPQERGRKTQLESVIPKTQAKLANAISASKPSGEMKRMLEIAQRGVIEGTENLQFLLSELVDFAEILDRTTTGAVSGAGQDLLSGNAVRSLAKNLQAATGSNINREQLVRAVTNQVMKEISIKPSKMSKPLTRAEQSKLQGRSSIRQYEQFGARAFTTKDQTSSSGVMHNIMSAVLQNMYPDRAQRGQGIGVTFKGLKDEVAKLGKNSKDSSSEETGFLSEIESLTEAVANGLEEMIKKDEAEEAAAYKGRNRKLSAAQASVKEAFTSMQTVEGNPDEEANRKELEAWVRGQLKELSFGARGGKGGRRIGGSFVPTQWEKLEKTGGYMEGGYKAKDMDLGFFPVEEATAMQDGFQYATITAQEFADAMLIAVEVFGQLQKVVPNPGSLVPYAGNKALSMSTPAPKLTQEQIAAWLKDNPQGFKPDVKLKASEAVFGKNTIGTTISAMIDAVNKKFMEPTGNVSEINSVIDLFNKLSPSMQNLIGVIEDLAIVEGKITANFKTTPGEDETMRLNLSSPHMNTLEQLFNSLNDNPSTTINGHKYQGSDYPGLGLSTSATSIPGLQIAKQLKKDFAEIYGGDMMATGKNRIAVDPRTFRPSTADNAIEMKAIDAFIENRRAFIEYIVSAGNKLVIDDITMGLPNVEKAFNKGSYTKFAGPGATETSYGELEDRQRLYAQDANSRRKARRIFGGGARSFAAAERGIERTPQEIADYLNSKKSGADTVKGIVVGLKNGRAAVEAESRVIAETIVGAYEDEMDIKSPSRRMARSGEQTVAGLFVGLKSGKVKLNEEGKKLAASFHSGYTEQEKADAAKRVQNYEKMGLTGPAANLRVKMSTSPVSAASALSGSAKDEIAARNAVSRRLIEELAGVKDAIIAWDVESSQESGVFAYGMVGGTGPKDLRGIGHDMVVPENFKLNPSESRVLDLKGAADLKKRIASAGYDVNAKSDPQAQRKMIEDIMYLIQVAIDKNVPIAMHNIGFSDFNSLQKMAKQYKISGAPARQARDKGLLIETQSLGSMLGMDKGPNGKPVSMKNEDLYQRLTGQAFGPQLIPGSGVVRKYGSKGAVAHDPTIDAAGTLVVATEQYKRIKGTTQKVVGFFGELIDTASATVQDISGILFGWKQKTKKEVNGVAIKYKGFDDSYVTDRPQPRQTMQGSRSASKAMAAAQRDSAKAVRVASEYDRLTREERQAQIQYDLDRVEAIKARLKKLAFARTAGNSPEQNRAHADLVRATQAELAAIMPSGSPLQTEWNARLGVTGGTRTGFGGGKGNFPPVSASRADQEFEAEAKARAVASKKIQGQMKGEMSVMADVERYNRKMMDSWISGRYALYDMANTYQQFSRAGMKVAMFLKQAILLNSQYETSFTAVERVMQPLTDEISGMRNELVKLTTELPVAFDELSRISTLAGQMGINASEITDFTKQVSQFGTVTGIATDEVAAKFGSIAQLTHTATNPEGFQKLGSAVAYTGINAVATDQEILTLTESIASASTQAGFAADETIGLATAMSSLRIPPEQARGVITRLFGDINRAMGEGGPKLQAYAKHLGLTSEQAKTLWEANPQGFFTQMLENVKNSKNSTLALDALNIKETREVQTITKLSENMEVYNSSMRDAAEAYKSGSFLAEAYGKTQDNVATKITLLQNQFKLLQDSIGEALTPLTGFSLDVLKGIVDGLTRITQNPVGKWATIGITAISGMIAAMVTFQMVQSKATASMLAFRTAGVAMAKMGGGEGGFRGFYKQLTGQEILIARSNGRIEVLTKKRLQEMKKLGEVRETTRGSEEYRAVLNNVDARRGQLESTDDIIAQKGALSQATLDETNQDRISTLEKDRNTASRARNTKASADEAAATTVAAGATSASVGASVASTAAIDAEIAANRTKIAALTALNVEIQANLGATPKEIANSQARIAANNAETASLEREIIALQGRRAAAAAGGGEAIAVVNKQASIGLGGIVGKVGMWGAALSGVLAIFAGISEAIEGTKVNLEDAGGGLASFREAIYADTRAWKDGGDAVSTYESKVVTSNTTLNEWATGLSVATGATTDLTSSISTTTDKIIDQTLALGQNSQAWLAKAAMSDTNVQDMFKKFYKVDGPGLGELAENAGTKISDIITAALAEPGKGATAYVEKNFNAFASKLVGNAQEVKAALLKIAGSLDSTTAAGVESSKMVEALAEGLSILGEEADYSGEQVDNVTEKVRTLTDYVGDLSSIMGSAFTIRYGKTEALDKLTTAWKQLKDRIKQAREEMSKIQQEITGMRADASILEYQLNIAIKYGDTKRADKLRADLAAKQQEITDKNTEMAKAQTAASTSLVGNSEAAVENRSTLRGLITDYNNYLAALANTAQFEGLSDKDAKKKKDYLKAQADKAKDDLITLATGLGFKENELAPYVKSFDDFAVIVNKLPKELTLKVVSDPGTRAFMEWWTANKGNFNPTGGAPVVKPGKVKETEETPAKPTYSGAGVDSVTGKELTKPEDILTKVKPTTAQATAKKNSSSEGMREAQKASYKAMQTEMQNLKTNFGGATTLADYARFNPKGTQAQRDAFLAAKEKFDAAKNVAKNWGIATAQIENLFKQSGKVADWDLVKESAVKTEQLSQTAAGKAYLEKQLKSYPPQVAEAIRFLRDRKERHKTDRDSFNSAREIYTGNKEKAGVPAELPWTSVLKNYAGQTAVIDGKKTNIIDFLTPYHDVYHDKWNMVKNNAIRGTKYRNLLKNSGYSIVDLQQFFYGDTGNLWAKDPGNNITSGKFYPLDVNSYAVGGRVMGPGSGTSDSVPAMLSNGEYVIRAKAAKALGTDTLDQMNHAEKFAKGGAVAKGKKPAKLKASSSDSYQKAKVLSTMSSYESLLRAFFNEAGQKFSINGKNPLKNVKFDNNATDAYDAAAYYQEGEGFTFGENRYDTTNDGINEDSGDWLSVDEIVSHEISHWAGQTLGKFGNYYKQPAWWPKGKVPSDILKEIRKKQAQLKTSRMSADRAERFNNEQIVPLEKLYNKMLAEEGQRKMKQEVLWSSPYATDIDTWEEFRADALAGAWQRLAGKKRKVNQENFFSTTGSIWSMSNTGQDEKHANSKTQNMLMDMGYAHPIELLKLLNIKVPKQFLGKDWSKEFEGSGIPKFNLGEPNGYDDLGTWRLFKPFKSGTQIFKPGPDIFNSGDIDLETFRQWTNNGAKAPMDKKTGLPVSYKDAFAAGGLVTGPGNGTSDSIAARLSNGEFVMQASAVRSYGLDFMNSLNQQQLSPRYAMQAAAPQAAAAQVVYLSPEDRNLLRAAIDRPVNLYTENARIAQSANAGNVVLAQRGRN